MASHPECKMICTCPRITAIRLLRTKRNTPKPVCENSVRHKVNYRPPPVGPTHSLRAQDDVVMLRRSACKHNDCAIKLYCHLFVKCRVIRSPISPIRTAQGNSTSQQSILCRIERPPSTPVRFLSFLPHFSRMCTIFFYILVTFRREKNSDSNSCALENCAKEPNMLTFSFFDFNSPPPISWNKRRLFFFAFIIMQPNRPRATRFLPGERTMEISSTEIESMTHSSMHKVRVRRIDRIISIFVDTFP